VPATFYTWILSVDGISVGSICKEVEEEAERQATTLRACLAAAATGAIESLEPDHPLEEETEENVMIFLTDDTYMRLLAVFSG
jgi:hypothetical protein